MVYSQKKEYKIFLVKWINSLEFRSGKTMILVNIISSFHGDKKKKLMVCDDGEFNRTLWQVASYCLTIGFYSNHLSFKFIWFNIVFKTKVVH